MLSPIAQSTDVTVPAAGATIVDSIFIADRTNNVSPSVSYTHLTLPTIYSE